MSEASDIASVRKSTRRHIQVSAATAVLVVLLVVLSRAGAAPLVISLLALAVALLVCAFAMHLYTERAAIQALMLFTAFFTLMMLVLMWYAGHDQIEGTEHAHDARVQPPGETH